MWEAVLDATGRSCGFHYNILGIDPDFRADNGFVPRTGFVQPSVANRFTLYGKPGALARAVQRVRHDERALATTTTSSAAKSLLEDHCQPMMQLDAARRMERQCLAEDVELRVRSAPYASYVPSVVGGAPTPFVPSDRIETLVSGFSVSTPQFHTLRGVGRHDARQRRRLPRDVARAATRLQRVARSAAERSAAHQRDVRRQRVHAAERRRALGVRAHPAREDRVSARAPDLRARRVAVHGDASRSRCAIRAPGRCCW